MKDTEVKQQQNNSEMNYDKVNKFGINTTSELFPWMQLGYVRCRYQTNYKLNI
jgi:hypothetical protein